jgi:hypothetical protein
MLNIISTLWDETGIVLWIYLAIWGFFIFKISRAPAPGKWFALAAIVTFGSILPLNFYVPIIRLKVEQLDGMALLNERCKSAGVKIMRTAENVESIQLLRVLRERIPGLDETDKYYEDAAFGYEDTGDYYIRNFLLFEQNRKGDLQHQRGSFSEKPSPYPGYRYVELKNPKTGERQCITFDKVPVEPGSTYFNYPLVRQPATGPAPRYAVTVEEIVNYEDRQRGVAGGIVKVIDQQTNEIMATFTAFRWRRSDGCPRQIGGSSGSDIRSFVDQVLKPARREETNK